ncbi:UDP-N-acetylmuramoyl-tripeptide--D-alanyl-D-alanine ligase [Nocardioides ultimimeridianus]
MIPMTLAEIADVVGGALHGPADLVVSAPAYVDSREPVAGGLFVAVVGERVDGHAYVADAHAVLGSRPTDRPTVVVDDPVAALGLLARRVVDTLGVPVLAMTGSQGKTGTKDYLAGVLRAIHGEAAVVATAGNNNNELGVPLTVLRATTETRFLVVEMGARGIGHIAELCRIAPPTVGALLNVGTAHVGEFGSRYVIAEAKSEIFSGLREGGTAVYNSDDALVVHHIAGDGDVPRKLSFGTDGRVTWRFVELDDLGRPSFSLGVAREDRGYDLYPVSLRQIGAHQVLNAAAAAAMAIATGCAPAEVAQALSTVEPSSRWRMELSEQADGLVVINDSYNANPESMRAGLEALTAIGERSGRRTVAVLGEMRELGAEHETGHRSVGRAAAELGVDVLVVVGEPAAAMADGARDSATEVILTPGRSEALDWLRQNAAPTDVVLVKASRGAALEWIAEQLLAAGQPDHAPDPAPDQSQEDPR